MSTYTGEEENEPNSCDADDVACNAARRQRDAWSPHAPSPADAWSGTINNA